MFAQVYELGRPVRTELPWIVAHKIITSPLWRDVPRPSNVNGWPQTGVRVLPKAQCGVPRFVRGLVGEELNSNQRLEFDLANPTSAGEVWRRAQLN
jgi:hypothetical protein